MKLTRNVNKNIRMLIATYNSLTEIHASSTLPNSIQFEIVTRDDWSQWQTVLCDMSVVPTLGQRQAIDAYNLWCRAEEEQDICKSDMACLVAFLKREHNVHTQAIELHRLSNSSFSNGAVHYLIQKVMSLELECLSCKRLFQGYFDFDITEFSKYASIFNSYKLPGVDLNVIATDTDAGVDMSDGEEYYDDVHIVTIVTIR